MAASAADNVRYLKITVSRPALDGRLCIPLIELITA
jgi:hypothetical protein